MDYVQLDARRKWLRMQREKLGWDQKELARRLRVTETEYVAFEEGRIEEHDDIDFMELKYYLEGQVQAKHLQGSQRIHMDRFEN